MAPGGAPPPLPHDGSHPYDQGGATPVADRAQTQRVLRNTYALLSMTLLFSAAVAAAGVAFKLPAPGLILTLVGTFGLLFAVHKIFSQIAIA